VVDTGLTTIRKAKVEIGTLEHIDTHLLTMYYRTVLVFQQGLVFEMHVCYSHKRERRFSNERGCTRKYFGSDAESGRWQIMSRDTISTANTLTLPYIDSCSVTILCAVPYLLVISLRQD